MTLVEVLVTIGIFSLTMLGITYMAFAGYKYYQFILDQAEITSKIQKNINLMSKEIREMRQADSGSFAIDTADDNHLVFYSNIDNESDVEKVNYFLSESCLRKGVTKPSGTPARYLDEDEQISDIDCNIDNRENEEIFSYYSGYPDVSTLMTTPADFDEIRVIGVYLRINSPSKNSSTESKIISIYISPRNINFEE